MANRPTKGKGKAYLWLVDHAKYQGDDCLQWPFTRESRVGRGQLGYNGKPHWAHRLMCELAHGKPPTPKHQAAHNCGKGHYGCVNPRHLEWKTNSQNQLDRAKNGNALRNPNGPRPSLTEAQITEMLSLRGEMTQVALAKRYGVSLGCVQYWLKYRDQRGHNVVKMRVWSKDEDALLRQAVANRDMNGVPGRNAAAVYARMRRLGIAPPEFTEYERKP